MQRNLHHQCKHHHLNMTISSEHPATTAWLTTLLDWEMHTTTIAQMMRILPGRRVADVSTLRTHARLEVELLEAWILTGISCSMLQASIMYLLGLPKGRRRAHKGSTMIYMMQHAEQVWEFKRGEVGCTYLSGLGYLGIDLDGVCGWLG